MNEELALGVAVTVIVVLFAKDVPVGVCFTVPGPFMVMLNAYFVTVVTAVPLTVAPISPPFVVKFRRAVRPPRASGVKVMLIVQESPTAMGEVQLFVCEKSPGFEPAQVKPETVSGAVARL